jgi:SAM-dependent methyltransferase
MWIRKNLKKLLPGGLYLFLKNMYFHLHTLDNRRQFFNNYLAFRKNNDNRFSLKWSNRFPCLGEATATTGFDAHYIYHPAWAARIIAETKPEFHIDISSTLTFCSIVSAFVPVKFYDYRPANLTLTGLDCGQADLLKLPFADGSIKSLSCMHTIEHVGLGRYGDPIDPTGDLKAMAELTRVLALGGNLLFVVPIGQPKLMFNAHRIYSYQMIINAFSDLQLKNFTLIPSSNKQTPNFNATKEESDKEDYACGCFWFTK